MNGKSLLKHELQKIIYIDFKHLFYLKTYISSLWPLNQLFGVQVIFLA